ncbi:PREDICTED: replication protein A 70 kDa DNA-binding subunit-like [Fragaria vesca subsp. vesca]
MALSITPISAIQPMQNGITIQVRVSRMWRGKIFSPVERFDGLQCVLVDKHNDAIHALIKEADYEDVKEKILAGNVYQISKFFSRENQDKYIVIQHEAQLLFNNRTQFLPMPQLLPSIPQYWFDFVDFDDVPMRKNNDTILTDLIGRLKLVYGSENTVIDGRPAVKRLIYIQNTRKQDLKVTLWGTLASEFDADMIRALPPPVMIVLTSTKVRYFDTAIINTGMSTCVFINPSIPETDEYKARFNKPYHALKILTAPARHHQPAPDLQDQNIITVSALNLQSGKKDKSPTFTCKAKITGFTIRDGWYYLACPTCSKSLKFNSGKLCCGHHGEQIGHPM